MARVMERTRGHYEVHEVPYGRDYAWRPECVTVECDCGERLALTATEAICGCGANHAALLREVLEHRASSGSPAPEDECCEWRRHEDEYLRSERNDWLEWETLE